MSPEQEMFATFFKGWLRDNFVSLNMAGGKLMGKADWVKGDTIEAYVRFQYKVVQGKVLHCVVLANIHSSERGGTRVVMQCLEEFAERTQRAVYVENILNPRVLTVCKSMDYKLASEKGELGLPNYFKDYSGGLDHSVTALARISNAFARHAGLKLP